GNEFQPTAVFLASAQNTTQAGVTTSARMGLGASDGTSKASIASSDLDNAATSSVQGYESVAKAFTKVDNSTSTINAEADLASFDADGFTLNWTTNDAVATELL